MSRRLTVFSFVSRKFLPACAVAAAFAAGAAGAATLEEAVAAAVGAHPKVRAVEASKRAAEEDVWDARSAFFPTVDLRVQTGTERVNNSLTRGRATRGNTPLLSPSGGKSAVNAWHKEEELIVTQMLFDGFDAWNRTEAAQKRARVAGYDLFDAREVIGLRAIQAYLQVVRNRTLLSFADENVEKHQEIYQRVKRKEKAGGANGAALYQSESRLALALARQVQFRGDVRDSESDYMEAVGSAPDELEMPGIPASGLPANIEDALKAAVEGNPGLSASTETVKANKADLRSAESPFYPNLNIEVTQNRSEDTGGVRGPSMEFKALAVMRYNLFQGGQDLARRKRAVELVSQATQLEAEKRRLVEEQMRLDFNAMLVASERLPILERRVLASSKALRTYHQQFDIGRRTLLDLLDVENELFQTKVDMVDGELQRMFALYRVLATMGQLLATLGTDVSVETETPVK